MSVITCNSSESPILINGFFLPELIMKISPMLPETVKKVVKFGVFGFIKRESTPIEERKIM